MYNITASQDAHDDADEIVNYIAFVLNNPPAANSFLTDLENCYITLANNPLIYTLCDDENLKLKGYRKVAIKNYLVFYRVDEVAQTVFIVRIIYSGRDYVNML